ncbi:unannotated protein [freshwater metagenome]|uniref:Unannotated protein n=1 Tax=freshwater metagenome TaxID=449393 RepID=A0A6J7DNM3_9ZZZZ|nr:hypothetical protein [Actinomycetota bacterium]
MAGVPVALPVAPRLHLPRPSLHGLLALPRRVASRLRGRALIFVFAGMLLGLVFLQVSLLKLNAGISANVEQAQVLERNIASKRALIARLETGQRIEGVASRLGMVMPGAGAVCYMTAGGSKKCSGGDPAAAASAVNPAAVAPADPATDQQAADQPAADAAPAEPAQPEQTPVQETAPAKQAPPVEQAPAQKPASAQEIGGVAAGTEAP